MTIQSRHIPLPVRLVCAVLSALTFGGCATFSTDGGIDAVSELTRERTGAPVTRAVTEADMAKVDATVQEMLTQPLTVEAAVGIALMSNRGLQASLAQLGISEADLVQAGRLRNPGFSFGRTRDGGAIEIERSIVINLIDLITMPTRLSIQRRRFEQVQRQAAIEAVNIAFNTRNAYYSAVAANESVRYMEQVKSAAEAGTELAREMTRVGNWSKLDQAREQAFHADAIAQLARAHNAAVAAREKLTRLLGLWGTAAQFKLPERLPDLPKAPQNIADIEQQAVKQRLDVQSARLDTLALASTLGLTRATGVVDAFELAYQNKSETGHPRANGYEIGLELPIFDWGSARAARAESMYMQSVHRTADVAIRARSEVRAAYSAYRTSYDIAKHYRDEVVPLRKKISDEMLLRYNGMLVSVFELLADARAQVAAVNASIEAQRDFWIADSTMQMALTGSGGTVAELDIKNVAADAGAGH